jgi:hypothetical protein
MTDSFYFGNTDEVTCSFQEVYQDENQFVATAKKSILIVTTAPF